MTQAKYRIITRHTGSILPEDVPIRLNFVKCHNGLSQLRILTPIQLLEQWQKLSGGDGVV
jgi:hypothetical protein